MAFNVVVGITPAPGALSTIDRVEQGLDDTSAAAGRATAALGEMGTAGAAAGEALAAGGGKARTALDDLADAAKAATTATTQLGTSSSAASEFTLRELQVLERIGAPAREWAAELAALNHLHQIGAVAVGDYEAQLMRAQEAYGATDRAESLLAESLLRETRLLEQITGPLREYEADLAALAGLQKDGKLTAEQYEAALAKVQQRAEAVGALTPRMGPTFDSNQAGRGLTEELAREQKILEGIQAPMREYEAQLKALQKLLKDGQLEQAAFDRELEKAQAIAQRAGAIGPVQGPKQQTGAPSDGGEHGGEHGGRGSELIEAVAPKFGAVGEIFGGLATKGTIATAAVVALGVELIHLGDEYIVLSNKARKVTEAGGSIDETLQQQLALSRELHGSIEATIELYDAVRDGTDELNLSQRQQVGLAREIGQAVLAEGKSIESAEGLMKRLTYAFASGAITGRDLKSIMREFPDIGAAFVQTLGHSRNELVAMANKGQISAEMLIDSFRKMNKEMAEKVDKQLETSGQKWQHFKDWVTVSAGGVGDALGEMAHESAVANAQTESGITIDTEAIKQQEAAARAARQRAEATRLLSGEQEKNAKTAQLAAAAGRLGIDFGFFDEEHANKVAELRIQMGQLGIDTEDVFEKAHAKASLFGRKLEEIQERKDAEKIAEDVKRIYDAMHGVSDLLEDQQKHWQKLSDDAARFAGAISMLQAKRLVSGAPQSQDERDLILQQANTKTELADAQYGKGMVSYAQGINTARAELDALHRAAGAGVIQGEAFRQKYDSIMATLNDGRLPEAIKIWEGLTLPVEQSMRDFAALNALLQSGRIGVSSYTDELKKIADADKSGNASEVSRGIARIRQEIDRGLLSWSDYDKAVRRVVDSLGKYQTTASGIRFRAEIKGPDEPSSLLPKNYQPIAPKGLTDNPELKGILAQYQSTGIAQGASGDAARLNDELERGLRAMDDFIAPSVKYEQRIKEIDLAVRFGGYSEEQITAARRKAKDTLNQETEALEAQKGPMEAYEAALRKLKDQLDAGDISQRKYAEGVDKAKLAMIEATGAAKTFSGAMQIEWIKLQQEAESFGATVEGSLSGNLGKLNDNMITALIGGGQAAQQTRDQLNKLRDEYNKGQVSAQEYATKSKQLNDQLNEQTDTWSNISSAFSSFVDNIIIDMERLLLKQLEMKAAMSLVGLFSGVGSGGSGGLADTSIGMEGWGGYATGGSFLVGGDGGVDTTPVAFRATRGERVTITPPGAYPYPSPANGGGTANGGGGGATVVHVHNHYDSAISQAALDGPGGQTSVMNTLRLKSGALRNLTSRPKRA